MEKLACAACGSSYITVEKNILICQSCDSKFIREPKKTDSQSQDSTIRENTVTEGFFPFAFDEAECEKAFRKWLVSDKWAPDDILLNAELTDLKRAYIPAYFFNVEYIANWKGSIGHDRTETNDDGNGNITYNTVTDWSLRDGAVNGVGTVGVIANSKKRNSGLPLELSRKTGWTPLDKFNESDRGQLLPMDINREKAFSEAQANLNVQAEATIAQNLSADRYKDMQIDLSIKRYDLEKLYFPFYMVTYTYDGVTYTVALDGRNWASGFAADRPVCEDLKKAASAYLKIAWIPVIPMAIVTVLFLFFETVGSRLTDIILGEIAIASMITFPIILIVGFIARGRFKKNAQAYRIAVKQELNSEHVNFDQLRLLEEKRAKQRKGTKWVRLLLIMLTLLSITSIATVNSMSVPYVQTRLSDALDDAPWAARTNFITGTSQHNKEARDEIGARLYAEFGSDLYDVDLRQGAFQSLIVQVNFEQEAVIDNFEEVVRFTREQVLEFVDNSVYSLSSLHIALLDEKGERQWEVEFRLRQRECQLTRFYVVNGEIQHDTWLQKIGIDEILETLRTMSETKS